MSRLRSRLRTLRRKLSILLIVLILLGGLTAWWFDRLMSLPLDPGGERIVVTIPTGTHYDGAVELLAKHRLVPEPVLGSGAWLFSLRARLRDRRHPLDAGLYRFDRAMSPDEIIDHLVKGADAPLLAKGNRVTIIPGHNIFQVDEILKRMRLSGDITKYPIEMATLNVSSVPLPAWQPKESYTTLEGYLYPDTYAVDKTKRSASQAVQKMLNRFGKVWTDLKVTHARTYARLMGEFGLRDHDFVILASLVEKEVAVRAEAPMVAGVFYNRLRKKMKLETDPTMVYGPRTWRAVPSPRYRKQASNPYNTYHIDALPPGPICNPGREALAAVLAPEATEALFFVAKGNGRHAFANTYDQHKANIKKYRRR